MRLLLDEHISPALVRPLAEMGVLAQFVPYVGLSGAPDEAVWAWAGANEMAVVTTNARDFLALAKINLHPGLIVLRESGLTREMQWKHLEPVVRFVLDSGERDFLLNKVVEIAAPGRFKIVDPWA
jgi:predicted nuclease of predicted toxin-antitoxin system